jgi:hypothetical protein
MVETVKKYVAKSAVVEAFQLDASWFDTEHPNPRHVVGFITNPVARTVVIASRDATFVALEGDWIIKGMDGKYSSCSDDIFHRSYYLYPEQVGE